MCNLVDFIEVFKESDLVTITIIPDNPIDNIDLNYALNCLKQMLAGTDAEYPINFSNNGIIIYKSQILPMIDVFNGNCTYYVKSAKVNNNAMSILVTRIMKGN